MTTDDSARGPIPLRPMDLGDLLDGAVRLFVANWRALLLAVGVLVVPLQLLAAFLQRGELRLGLFQMFTDPTPLGSPGPQGALLSSGQLAALAVTGLAFFLVLPVLAGAVCVIVGRSYLGQAVDWRTALGVAWERFGSLLGAAVLVHLVEFGLLMPALVVFSTGLVTGSGGLAVLGLLLLLGGIVGVIIAVALYAAVAPAVVIEGIGPVAAMRRSRRLRQPRLWPTVGAVIVAGLLAVIVGGILGFLPQAVGTGLGGPFAWVLVGVSGLLSQLVQIPFTAIVATLLYFDGRIRQEGFDLQMMAADLDR
ncbi:MAG: hypothetical protein ACRDYA_24835 [Egibacteraceae bacterium]